MKKLLIVLLALTSCQTTSDVQENYVKPVVEYEDRFNFILKYRYLKRPLTIGEIDEINESIKLMSKEDLFRLQAPFIIPINPKAHWPYRT